MSKKAIAINAVTIITLILIALFTESRAVVWIAGVVAGSIVVGSILFWVVKDFIFGNNNSH